MRLSKRTSKVEEISGEKLRMFLWAEDVMYIMKSGSCKEKCEVHPNMQFLIQDITINKYWASNYRSEIKLETKLNLLINSPVGPGKIVSLSSLNICMIGTIRTISFCIHSHKEPLLFQLATQCWVHSVQCSVCQEMNLAHWNVC